MDFFTNAGVLLSRLARDLVVATSSVSGTRQRELLGRTVQAIILVTARWWAPTRSASR